MPTSQLPALPSGFTRQEPTLGPSSSDSATAYVCAPAPDSSHSNVATWLTRDRGANWQPIGSITVDVGSPIEVTNCQIVVDTTQTAVAVAQVGYLPAGGCVPAVDCIAYVLYQTTDMGQQWTRLQPPLHYPGVPYGTLDTIATLATYHQVTYAVFHTAPRSASFGSAAFMVSHDNLHSWTPITGVTGIIHPATNLDFWLNPWSGDLLVVTMSGFYNQETFLTSSDGGYSWTMLKAPPFRFAVFDIVVQQPFTNQLWHICGGDPSNSEVNGVQQNTHMGALACTADGGAHWVTHQLGMSTDLGGGSGNGANYTLVGIADDGSVLLVTPVGLERGVGGSDQLQALGPAPDGGQIVYAAGSGAGVLWSAPQNNYTDPDPQGRIYTATYA